MGYTIRTCAWRYTEWPQWTGRLEPNWDAVEGVELYAHTGDDGSCLDCFENENVAMEPAHKDLVRALSKQLRAAPATRLSRPISEQHPYVEMLGVAPFE